MDITFEYISDQLVGTILGQGIKAPLILIVLGSSLKLLIPGQFLAHLQLPNKLGKPSLLQQSMHFIKPPAQHLALAGFLLLAGLGLRLEGGSGWLREAEPVALQLVEAGGQGHAGLGEVSDCLQQLGGAGLGHVGGHIPDKYSINLIVTMSLEGQRIYERTGRTTVTYKTGALLGKGGFARCYELEDEDGVVSAVKVI